LTNNNPLLILALCCLLIYAIKSQGLNDEDEANYDLPSEKIYIEIDKVGDSPIVLKLGSESEVDRLVYLYDLSRKPRNGDKVIMSYDGAASFSRMNGRKSLSLGVPIGINSAGVNDLDELPGIGPKLAERIIEYRTLRSSFSSIDELYNVDGIGQKKLEAIRPLINLD
jgi:competence ComEA-like helix-hairpin-helix protein